MPDYICERFVSGTSHAPEDPALADIDWNWRTSPWDFSRHFWQLPITWKGRLVQGRAVHFRARGLQALRTEGFDKVTKKIKEITECWTSVNEGWSLAWRGKKPQQWMEWSQVRLITITCYVSSSYGRHLFVSLSESAQEHQSAVPPSTTLPNPPPVEAHSSRRGGVPEANA